MKRSRPRIWAAAAGAALSAAVVAHPVSAAVPESAGNLPKLGSSIAVSRLPAGGVAIVRPEQGAPVAAIELWFRAPSIGFDAKPQPGLARLAAQAVAASKPIVGTSLSDTVSAEGGRLSVMVYSDSLEISVLVPTSDASKVIKAMTTAYFAPVFTVDGFHAAQRDGALEALFADADVGNVVRDAVFAQLFRDGPQHFSTFIGAKSIADLSFAQAQAFATRAFRSPNATLVISGAVDAGVAASAAAGRTQPDQEPERPLTGAVNLAPGVPTTHALGAASGGLGWLGPPIEDEREATAMDFIADYLFRPDTGTVTREVARSNPKALLLGQFITLHDPGVMFVAYGGGDAALSGLISGAVGAMEQPLAPAAFTAARAAFEYHLFSDLQTPVQLADALGWYAVEGDAAYAPDADGDHDPYLVTADSLTPGFVAGVARKFLGKPGALVTFTPGAGKAP